MNKTLKTGKENFLPFISFFIIFTLSILGFLHLEKLREERRQVYFNDRIVIVEKAIETRIKEYNQILLGTKGFVEESDTVTRTEWRYYIEKLNVDENYPGIQGIGYTVFISPNQLNQHIQFMRINGYPNYSIKPLDKRTMYTSIIFIEPYSGDNLKAFGYDMFSEPVRNKAMVIARDSGLPALSGKVTLIQEDKNKNFPGFLIYIPVYKSGKNPQTVEERRKLIRGYVYSPFRASDIFQAILKNVSNDLSIRIYDGNKLTKESLLFENALSNTKSKEKNEHALTKINKVNISSNTWTIEYNFNEKYITPSDQKLPYIILIGGILFGILIFLMMVFQGKSHAAKRESSEIKSAKHFIMESMPEKVFTADKYGNINYTNSKWQEYTGLTLTSLKDSLLDTIIHPDDKAQSKKILNEAISTGNNFSIEQRLKRKDGIYRWHLSLGTSQKDEQGNVISWVVTHTDINEQKSQLDEVKRINIDLDNFVYTASHDLKAPISNMEGLLTYIIDETEQHCTEDVTGLFDMIKTSINRLKTTILDLTEISRIQRGYESEVEEIHLDSIIKEFRQDFKEMIEKNQAKINTELTIPTINFSVKNIRSILYNLLSNAIKYRSKDRVPEIYVKSELYEKEWILISVKDNGLGLNSSQIERIFGMFKRMHTHVEGTGIGLYIVKRIVENAGGKITVESLPGNGSVFKVFLPIKL